MTITDAVTAFVTVNRTVRSVTMTPTTDETPRYAAYLMSKGYTGQTFLGHAPAEGRKRAVGGLWIRTMGGQFVPAF